MDIGAVAPHPRTAKRQIDIVAKPVRERDVPAPPELRDRYGGIRSAEILGDAESEDPAQADRGLKGRGVLVADDDPGICRTLKEILEAEGCIVDTARDGAEALERIESSGSDLVLTDVVMPNMDGHELYLQVQSQHPELPVLMMTAFHYDKDHIIKQSRMKGLEGVIFKKPVDPARLREAIVDTVRKREATKGS